MKLKKKTVWEKKDGSGERVRISRLRKTEVCFHPEQGGGPEQRLDRKAFLEQYTLTPS